MIVVSATTNNPPAAPAGYSFKGYETLTSKANGGGTNLVFAVYTKN
jgi:hypothetical protein